MTNTKAIQAFPKLSTIARRRKGLGMTQKELADAVGISQSLLTKIERNLVGTSYDIAVRIFMYLDEMTNVGEETARDVMQHDVITLRTTDTVSRAIRIAKEHAISQFPVVRGGSIVGAITTNDMIGMPKDTKISSVVREPFPMVVESTPVSTIKALLNSTPAVVVVRKDAIVGLVTPENLI